MLYPVTKEQFFAVINPMDITTVVDKSTLKGRFHKSSWETPARMNVGQSVSDCWGIQSTQFWLNGAYAQAAR